MKNVDGIKERKVLDLKSQDLATHDMVTFRDTVLEGLSKTGHQELISFNSGSKPYNYSSLDEFRKMSDSIPDNASYFSYTMTFDTGDRCSIYLDPDRPGKLVIEGKPEFVSDLDGRLGKVFPKGSERYVIHKRMGIFIIWALVISMAAVILLITSLLIGPDAIMISSVILTSSILGIYLSVVKSKEIQPANTISFIKRRNYWLDTVLHMLTIALGILSAVLATIILQSVL